MSLIQTFPQGNAPTSLNDNSDVNINSATLTDDQILKYNETSEQWENKTSVINRTVNLLAASWVGESAPYTQTVSVAGILASDNPIVDISVSDTVETGLLEIADWAKISKATSGAGSITFSCYEEKPTNDLIVNIKVVR